MNDLNVVHLRYARAVADAGSFSAAARACSVTQPALSNGIAVLERRFGGRLFDRTTRGVTPTAFGARLLPLIDTALRGLDAVLVEARLAADRGRRPLRIGVSPMVGPGLIGRAFEAVSDVDAGGVVLHAATVVDLRQALADAELDLLLIPVLDTTTGVERATVHHEPMMYLASGAHPQPGERGPGEPIDLADTTATPLILPTDACGLSPFTRKVFADHGLDLRTYPGEAHDCRTVQDWAALGLGSALLPVSKVAAGTPARPVLRGTAEVTIAYEACWLSTSPLRDELAGIVAALRGPLAPGGTAVERDGTPLRR